MKIFGSMRSVAFWACRTCQRTKSSALLLPPILSAAFRLVTEKMLCALAGEGRRPAAVRQTCQNPTRDTTEMQTHVLDRSWTLNHWESLCNHLC